MRKQKHWLYAITFLGGCLLLAPGNVLAGETFSYQLNDNTEEAKETIVSSSVAANTALSEMNLIFDVTFPMTAEGETEDNPEMRIETSLDIFGEKVWWEGSVYLNDTLSYCYLVDASTGNVIDPIVHITKTGEKYHSAGCRYLKKSDIEVTLSEAKNRGLTPCSKCNPPR